MMTPQEVLEKKFKPVMMGGYETASVDAFLETVTEDYSSLYKENAVLKSKLKVLVEKVEEYRTVDAAMRQALLAAQKMAAEMVSDAKKQSEEIVRQSQTDAQNRERELKARLSLEEKRLETAQKQTITFVNGLRELYGKQIDMLAGIPVMDIPESRKVAREKHMTTAVSEIDKSMKANLREPLPFGAQEPAQTPPPAIRPAPPPPAPQARPMLNHGPEDDIEEVTEPTQRIPPNIRHLGLDENGMRIPDDTLPDSFPVVRDPDDTEVPPPRREAPADIDRYFGHPH